MPRITEEQSYNGVLERVTRLGLEPLLHELRDILIGFTLQVEERRDANGGAAVRKLIDKQFEHAKGWTKKQTTSGRRSPMARSTSPCSLSRATGLESS